MRRARRVHRRRAGWLAVMVSGFVNLSLFVAIAMTGQADVEHGLPEDLVVLETFLIELPTPPQALRAGPDVDSPRSERVPAPEPCLALPAVEPQLAALAPRLANVRSAWHGLLSVPSPPPLDLSRHERAAGEQGTAGGGGGGPAQGVLYETSEVDRAPTQRHAPLPAYPLWARRRGAEGRVQLRVHVSADGRVVTATVKLVDGDHRFGTVARDAVLNWEYEPAQLSGRAVPCVVLQRVWFDLED